MGFVTTLDTPALPPPGTAVTALQRELEQPGGISAASPIPVLLFSHSVSALSAGAMEIDAESLWLLMELP